MGGQLGTLAGDLIYALAGNDRILADPAFSDALGGDDVVYAGSGDDQVYAIGGDNRIYGEEARHADHSRRQRPYRRRAGR